MSKKLCKIISLTLAIFLMSLSLGACGKTSENKARNDNTKVNATTKSTRSVSVKNTIGSTNKGDSTKNSEYEDKNINDSSDIQDGQSQTSSSDTLTSQQIKQLEFTDPSDNIEIIPTDPNIDLKGATIRIVYDTSLGRSPGEYPTNLELEKNPKAIVRYNTIEAAKKKLNCNIDWIYKDPENIAYDYIETNAAGNKFADIILSAPKRVFPLLAVKKLLVPIDNYIDFKNDPIYNLGNMTTGTEFMGRKWGFTAKPYGIGYVTFYRRDILAREGLEDLQQLYKEGGWTWDAMLEYARTATHDTNGDGVIDQWGVLLNSLDNAAHALMLSNGADIIRYDSSENTYKFTGNDIKVTKALQLINDMVSSQLTTSNSAIKFDKNPSAIVIGKVISDGMAYKQYGINYGIAPLPKGPDVSETQFVDGNGVDAYFIPVNTDSRIAATVIKEAFTYWDTNKSDYMTKEEMLSTDLEPYLTSQTDVQWTIENFPSPKVSQLKDFTDFRKNYVQNVLLKVASNQATPEAVYQAQAGALQNDLTAALQN